MADNQTRDYATGTPERRRYLHGVAWGTVPSDDAIAVTDR